MSEAISVVKLEETIGKNFTVEAILYWFRQKNWAVAVHNDYMLNENKYTFYLLTHPSGIYVKSEAPDDFTALVLAWQKVHNNLPSSGINSGQKIHCIYTNHRGETAFRNIQVIKQVFDKTTWHPEEQWLLHGIDLDKKVERIFAMRDMKNVKRIIE